MSQPLMNTANDTQGRGRPVGNALWQLPAGAASRLEIGPGPRELVVCAGRLWLTFDQAAPGQVGDQWLSAGESLPLAAGQQVVLEGWPSASFQLLVPPQDCPRWQSVVRRGLAVLGRWLQGLQPGRLQRPA